MIHHVTVGRRAILYERGTQRYTEAPGTIQCAVQFLPSGEGMERAFLVLQLLPRLSVEVFVEFDKLPEGRFKKAAIMGSFEEGVEFTYEVTDGKLIITSLVLSEDTCLATEMSDRSYP
jgi:hypothetical protein